MTTAQLIERLGQELGSVIGAILEKPASATTRDAASGAGYVVTVTAAEGGEGTLSVHFDRDGADGLTKLVLQTSEAPPAATVIDTLKDVCGQATASVVEHGRLAGVRLVVESVDVAADVPAGAAAVKIVVGTEDATVSVALWGTLEILDAQAVPEKPRQVGSSPALDVILDMDLPLTVRFGQAELTMKTLAALRPGSLIDLGRSPDDPVEVLVSNRVIAHGEVVVVGGQFGVRITNVMNNAAQARDGG